MLDLGNFANNPWTIVTPPGMCYGNTLIAFVQNGVILLIVLLIVAGILMAILAGIRIITSGGVVDVAEEGFSTIKNIFIGLVLAIFTLIAIIIITSAFFPEARKLVQCDSSGTPITQNIILSLT